MKLQTTNFLKWSILVLALVYNFRGWAQPYRTICEEREAYFQYHGKVYEAETQKLAYNQNFLLPLVVEKASASTEGIALTLMQYAAPTKNAVYTPWYGNTLKRENDGTEWYFNQDGEAVEIQPQASLREKWVVYAFDSGERVTAEVVRIEQLPICGSYITDRVKTILLEGSNIPNGTVLQISEHFGWVTTLDWYQFPKKITKVVLKGLNQPNIGENNLTDDEVFNYEIGDEFHITTFHTQTTKTIHQQVFSIERIIGKKALKDTTIYNIHRKMLRLDMVAADTSFLEDTVSLAVGKQVRPILPMQFIPAVGRVLHIYPDSIFGRAYALFTSVYAPDFPIAYAEGLGGPYFYAIGNGANRRTLNYYKKKDEVWGTPFEQQTWGISKSNTPLVYGTSVFPNPCKDQLFFSSKILSESATVEVKIINQFGQVVLKQENTTDNRIRTEQLPAGFYYLLLITEEGKRYKATFMKTTG